MCPVFPGHFLRAKDPLFEKLEYTVKEDGSHRFLCRVPMDQQGSLCDRGFVEHFILMAHCRLKHKEFLKLPCPTKEETGCGALFTCIPEQQAHVSRVHQGEFHTIIVVPFQ